MATAVACIQLQSCVIIILMLIIGQCKVSSNEATSPLTSSSSSSAVSSSSSPSSSAYSQLPTAVSSDLFKCPDKFGYYSDTTDCSKYFVCVFGEPLHETCTGGLFFHAELQTCDWPRNVPCADGVDRYKSLSTSSNSDRDKHDSTNVRVPSISVFDVVDDSPDEIDKTSVTRSPNDYDLIVDKLQHDLHQFNSNHTNGRHVAAGNDNKLHYINNSSNNASRGASNHPNHHHQLHHQMIDYSRTVQGNQLQVKNISSFESDRSRDALSSKQEAKNTSNRKAIVFPTLPLTPPSKSKLSDPHHNKIIIDNDDPQPPIYESEAIPPVVDSKGGIHFSDGPGGTYGLSQQIPGILSNQNSNSDSYHSSVHGKSLSLPTLSLFTIKPISLRDKERIASSLTSLLGKRASANTTSDLNHHSRYISNSRYRPKQYSSDNSNEYIPVISPDASIYTSKRPSDLRNDRLAPAPVSFFNDSPIRSVNSAPISYTSSVPAPKLPPPPPPPPTKSSIELEHLRSQASYSIQPPRSYISPSPVDSIRFTNDSSSIVMIPMRMTPGVQGLARVKVIPRVNSYFNNPKNVYFDDEGAMYEHINAPWTKHETSYPPTPFTSPMTSTSTTTTTTSTTTSTTTTTPKPKSLSEIETIYGRKDYDRDARTSYGHVKYDLDTNIDDLPDEYDDEFKYTSRLPYRPSSYSTVPPPPTGQVPSISLSKSPYRTPMPVMTTTPAPPVTVTTESLSNYSPYFIDHDPLLSINRSIVSTTVAPFARIITTPVTVTSPKTMKSYRKKASTTTTTTTTTSTTTESPVTVASTTSLPVNTMETTTVKYKNNMFTSPTVRSVSNRSTTISIVRQLSAKRSRPTNKRLIVKYRTTQAPKLPSRPESVKPTPIPLSGSTKCDPKKCTPPDCNCGGPGIPNDLKASQVPQIVLITFDDAINDLNWEIYEEIFHSGRKNPNGCPPLGTFYVSHEWTDYGQVQSLYARGHEIASHGITHSFGEKFSKSQWLKEIQGQREILHLYGGVKLEDIRGMRAPFLQVGGNRMFEMLYEANFTYDSSMPVFDNRPPFYPYTLDYSLNHECMITPCPSKSFPGLWEVGMVMWEDLNGGRCSMGDACSNPSDENGIFTMLLKNFKRHYDTNRAPFGLFYHSAWFNTVHHRKGFIKFIDEIMSYGDVYLTTNWQMLQWMRNPTPLNKLKNFEPWLCDAKKLRLERPEACNHPSVCNLRHESGSRFMKTCQPCPSMYPWVGNTGFGKQMTR